MTTGSLRLAGYNGYYWATTAYSSELYAYYLDFNSTNVNPSANDNRWYGLTVQRNILRKFRRLTGKNTKVQGKLIAINDKFVTSDGELFLNVKNGRITGVDSYE